MTTDNVADPTATTHAIADDPTRKQPHSRNPAVRCTGTNRDGTPCNAFAIHGGTRCRMHGGQLPRVKAAAKRRIAEANARRRLDIPDHVDPRDALARELATTDAGCAQDAVRRMIQTDEYPPTVARIITAARGVAQGRDAQPALPSPRPDATRSARAMGALNALYAQMDRPAHDHHRGAEACPSCSTKADRLTLFADEAADLLGDYGIVIDPDRAARYAIDGQPG